MKIKFFKAEEFEKSAKATVHKSGKLGFSKGAIDLLEMERNAWLLIGSNEDNDLDENLYSQPIVDKQNDAFKINKAGVYYYVNTKNLFDKLGVDYKNSTVIYDIIKIEDGTDIYFKMIRRNIKKKNKIMADDKN